jgi:D-glycero-D-manno-heptose 1,7-bisphosphate phosphatase
MTSHKRCFVLLNRDGVINRRAGEGCVTSWNQFEFLPRALDGLRLLATNGWTVLVVSNQPCVGEGLLSAHELQTLTRRLLLEVAMAGGRIAKVYYCPHTDADRCLCRKPLPGLLLRAINEYVLIPKDTYVIGDSEIDMEAAARAGCRGIRLRRDALRTAGVRREDDSEVASNLYEVAKAIVRRGIPSLEKIAEEPPPISQVEDPLAVSRMGGTGKPCS